jgi:hypothetical protein
LARDFGKCQNQVPEAQPAWHIPMTGFIPPAVPRLPLKLL